MDNTSDVLLKIAIVGPESTGKSTVAHFLAKSLGTLCVPEYARYYCRNLHNQYTLQDEVNMFYGQIALEDALLSTQPKNILICDTTILTVKIWCDHLFGDTPQEVKNEIQARDYDLYLLMDIDLPWQDDPLRDFPGQQAHFMDIWHKELKTIHAHYEVIAGVGEERFTRALQVVKNFSDSQIIKV